MEKRFWLYLEPYTHAVCKLDDVMLYNTLDGRHIIYRHAAPIAAIVRRMLRARNMRVILLRAGELKQRVLAGFVADIRKYYMGDVLDADGSSAKPVVMGHGPKIQKDRRRLVRDEERSPGEAVLEYLTEISIFLTGRCVQNCAGCRDYCKQFLCCSRGRGKEQELALQTLDLLCDQLQGSQVSRINITGGDIFQYTHLAGACKTLGAVGAKIVFYAHYLNWHAAGVKVNQLDSLSPHYIVTVTPPYKQKHLSAVHKEMRLRNRTVQFEFVVQNVRQVREAQKTAAVLGISALKLKPFFDGVNAEFFHRHVFMDEKDIIAAHPTHVDIYANAVLNRLRFGRLFVLADGRVHADLNTPPLGSLKEKSLHALLYKEMRNGKNWFRLRRNVKPCRHCLMVDLCPPLGAYEYALGRNDLCLFQPADVSGPNRFSGAARR